MKIDHKDLPADYHLFEEYQLKPIPYSEYYGFLKNTSGFTYEELVEMGYTPELGFTLEVFNEVYDRDNPMNGGYTIEDGNIIPAKPDWMTDVKPGRYLVESFEGIWTFEDVMGYFVESKIIEKVEPTDQFMKQWKKLKRKFKVDDDELEKLVRHLTNYPDDGDSDDELDGVCKLRWRITKQNIGKSGGIRIIYLYVDKYETIFLLRCYSKGQQEVLTAKEKKSVRQQVRELKGE